MLVWWLFLLLFDVVVCVVFLLMFVSVSFLQWLSTLGVKQVCNISILG